MALIYSSEAGKREATLGFDVGQGTQDLGFRGECPVLFDVRPAIPVKLAIARPRRQADDGPLHVPRPGRPRLSAAGQAPGPGPLLPGPGLPPRRRDRAAAAGRVHHELRPRPGVPCWNAEDHRAGEGRGRRIAVKLERWVNPADYGFYSGDHHIHAAGCAHYTNPTEGVLAEDMFLHVKGEGLNVGCILTWGPCYDFQRQFFDAEPRQLERAVHRAEIRRRSQRLRLAGPRPCLPAEPQGPDLSRLGGTKTKGWPTWTTPLMRWAKAQGAVTGYAHSASGLHIDPVRGRQAPA